MNLCWQIKVGVSFDDETTLMLRNPADEHDLGSYSKMSLFVKTNQQNGFLAYIGPDHDGDLGKVRTNEQIAFAFVTLCRLCQKLKQTAQNSRKSVDIVLH